MMVTFSHLKKNLKREFSGFRKIRLALLADSSSQLLNQALRGFGYEAEIDFDIYEADYNQIDLQILDGSSGLYSFEPEFVFINISSEHLLKEFYHTETALQRMFADNMLRRIKIFCETISAGSGSKIIISSFPEINDSVFGNYAAKTNASFIYQLRKTNLMLMEYAQQVKDLFICDIALLQSELGRDFTFDPKLYVNSDMVYSIDFLSHISRHVTNIIQSIIGVFQKCLILDLDNTIWGGIIGDDGMEGIQLGDLGIGKAFTELQLWVKQLKKRGIIIAICSKNTEELAREPFESHPDMILKLEDIAVFAVNWNTKVENIRNIQKVLSIGYDSMIFVDDNPFEREMVRTAIPGVTIPDLPEDPADYLKYLRGLNLFEIASVTDEDEVRTKQYQEEAVRNSLHHRFENEEEFLASLGMEASVKPFDSFTLPRIAQLSQRSNQFNLRTVRYAEEDIRKLMESDSYQTLSFSLRDRIGDHGLIGMVILKKLEDHSFFIDSWIMSCRVLNRGMENFTLDQIIRLAKENGVHTIRGEYLPTRKNGIVKDHYHSLGFMPNDDQWVLGVDSYQERENFINRL